ncbi:MAG: hypothetical protein QOJ39_3672 [Candidatus Eremiobacteraeota bacterium]|nr:hypothetical protein [Candidatus Eremiobacteraeota bacterium]
MLPYPTGVGEKPEPTRAKPPPRLYRVGYSADVAAFASWDWLTGTGRWDDPQIAALHNWISEREASRFREDREEEEHIRRAFAAEIARIDAPVRPYRVLYTAGSRKSAYIETFQRYRSSGAGPLTRWASAMIDSVLEDADDIPPSPPPSTGPGTGRVGTADVSPMFIGEIDVGASDFANLETAPSVQYIHDTLQREAKLHGIPIINRGAILGNVLPFTQAVSAFIYRCEGAFSGIRHDSTHGTPHECWAVFERPTGAPSPAYCETAKSEPVSLGDPDLCEALDELGIRIV